MIQGMSDETLLVAICDDNQEDLKMIGDTVRNCVKSVGFSGHLKCYLFYDGEEMYEAGQREHFDLFLLDIEMPGVNGFQLAKRICSDRTTPCLIFVSAYESFVFDSQEFMPLWFVRKTMLKRDLHKALQKYFELTALKKPSYQLKSGSVYISDIVYIESNGHLLTIQKSDGKSIRQYGSLKEMEEELSKYDFLRIHKSYLVNQRYIKEMGRQEICLTNGIALEMGRDRRKFLREAICKYISESNEFK